MKCGGKKEEGEEGEEGKEGFSNLDQSIGEFPLAVDLPILHGDFPLTGAKGVSKLGSANLWKYKPVFEVGSFEQITNNEKNIKNPDDGSCTPGNFCGALYKDRKEPSNVINPLPPVAFGQGARVGYYRNEDYLLQFNNQGNMLY
jgi:hypothetical protein